MTAWAVVDSSAGSVWGNADTAQTATWTVLDNATLLFIGATSAFADGAFAELAFIGELASVPNVGGGWQNIQVT